MHFGKEIPQTNHKCALFESPQMGNLITPAKKKMKMI